MAPNSDPSTDELYARWAQYDTGSLRDRRERMVEQQIAERGITDKRLLDVMRHLPRHHFVPPSHAERAYEDRPQEIGARQTISQPFMVALMTQVLNVEAHHTVLDVGTGSGYQAAILALLCETVYTVEMHASLLESAETRFAELGLHNIETRLGDGSEGWFEHAPYDRILVAAGAPDVPDILQKQLADGGRLVIPIGSREIQQLMSVDRNGDRFTRTSHCECMFVPLLGNGGWDAS